MEQPDPPLVKEEAVDAAERSLVDDVRALVDDGRTLLEAELAYQKSRAALAGRTAKSMAGWIALALSLVFFALMTLVMGLLLILA
ncbi:MAG: phage holin family protein, partial [Novosphingobium sp.]